MSREERSEEIEQVLEGARERLLLCFLRLLEFAREKRREFFFFLPR